MKKYLLPCILMLTLATQAQTRTSVNVKTMGAVGDGVTDDTQALQQAFDYCGKNGFDVYIPAGTYIVSAVFPNHCLRVSYDNMVLKGDDEKTIIKNKDHNPNAGLILVEPMDPDHKQIKGIRINHFTLDGNKKNQAGLYEHKLLRVNVSNKVNETADIIISNMTCHDAYSGVLPTEGGGISLESWDKSLRYDSIYRQNIEVYNCVCNDNGGWGIGTNWSCGINIHDNITQRNATMGITIWNSMSVIVKKNASGSNIDYDINLEASERVLVDSNTITSTTSGIRNHNSLKTILSNNNITYNSEWYLSSALSVTSGIGYGDSGMFKRRPSSDVLVTNNNIVCTGGKANGIRIYKYTDGQYKDVANVTIQNNSVQSAKSNKCMELFGANIVIKNNSTAGKMQLNGKQYIDKNAILQKVISIFQ